MPVSFIERKRPNVWSAMFVPSLLPHTLHRSVRLKSEVTTTSSQSNASQPSSRDRHREKRIERIDSIRQKEMLNREKEREREKGTGEERERNGKRESSVVGRSDQPTFHAGPTFLDSIKIYTHVIHLHILIQY